MKTVRVKHTKSLRHIRVRVPERLIPVRIGEGGPAAKESTLRVCVCVCVCVFVRSDGSRRGWPRNSRNENLKVYSSRPTRDPPATHPTQLRDSPAATHQARPTQSGPPVATHRRRRLRFSKNLHAMCLLNQNYVKPVKPT